MTNPEYCAFSRSGSFGYALRGEQDALIPAMLDRAGCQPVDVLGRGAVFTLPLRDGTAIVREYRRGGIVRRALSSGTLVNRPRREWEVLTHVHRRGLPVPQPLAVVWQRRWGLVHGAIATRRVHAQSLIDFLKTEHADRDATLHRVGEVIRYMHELGVYHADLHAGNILVGDNEVYIVDFDRATLPYGVPETDRARNLLRLRRSFWKRGLRMTDFERVRFGYGPVAWPQWLEWLYDAKGAASDALRGGLRRHAV